MPRKTQTSVDRRELAHLAAAVTARARATALSAVALEGLAAYLELLARWNVAFNLVGPDDWRNIFTSLVTDSIYLADFLRCLPLPDNPQMWDLGAGAGLPGIPLRLVWTQGEYYMVERREKRAIFLSTVLAHLSLKNTHVFRGSAESFFESRKTPHGRTDGIVSRAFLPWRDLLDLAQPHLNSRGTLIIFASEDPPEELPAPWTLTDACTYYVVADKKRCFWALSPSRD
ncbi:MAG: 16S rRNA (guanine(527)-N(7))-methyltransferase RsmG [Desulfovibrio sp.]|nr:16S rRNA (guanine(527)-N(7))-methyltransferase RsmG [Desulfovibrio sp.]